MCLELASEQQFELKVANGWKNRNIIKTNWSKAVWLHQQNKLKFIWDNCVMDHLYI